jgi:hypothetical protein
MIRDVDPDRCLILRLYTMDPLHQTHKVKWVKIMQPDGTLIYNDNQFLGRLVSSNWRNQLKHRNRFGGRW